MSYLTVDRLIRTTEMTCPAPAASASFDVTGAIPLTLEGSKNIRVDIEYSDATITSGISAKLQSSNDGVNWFDTSVAKSVVITAAVSTHTIKTLTFCSNVATDAAGIPLQPLLRVLVTLQTDDVLILTAVKIIQDWN
jgi:hypothetical protein